MTWILNEDAALKERMSGMTVSDDRNPNRPVGVWFGQPDIEVREQQYPYVTIDLIDLREATDRAQRGIVRLPYVPDGGTPAGPGQVKLYDYPIPYDLYYQVRTWARHPRHDRQMMNEILRHRLPARYGSLYIPEDETVRSMFMLGMVKRDVPEQQRRLFSNVFTVTVATELTQEAAFAASQVLNIALTVSNTNT